MSTEKSQVLTVEITDENIQKAYEVLGIPLANENPDNDIEKGKKAENEEEGLEKTKKEKAEDLKEQIEGKDAVKDKTPDAGHEDDKENGKIKGEEEEKKEKEEPEEKEDKEDKEKKPKKEIKKGEEVDLSGVIDLLKGIQDDLNSKTAVLSEKITAVGILEKAVENALISKFTSIQELTNDLQKAFEDSLHNIEERLGKIENSPIPRKSVTRTSDILNKGEDNDLDKDEPNTLSITRDRKQVMEILKAKSGIDGGTPNESFMQALLAFEASGSIDKGIRTRLLTEDKIHLVN